MAKHAKGILGGFSGKVGTVVGSVKNGQAFFRSRPTVNKKGKLTEAQKSIRAKFKLGSDFVRAIRPLIEHSFQTKPGEIKENAALSVLLTQAIGGVYPNLFMVYSAAKVAKGKLKKADNAAAVSTVAGKIQYSWTDNTGLGSSTSLDKAILVAYCPAEGDALFTIEGATRDAEEATFDVRLFAGKLVHTWIAFRSPDGKTVSDSSYTGMVTVAV